MKSSSANSELKRAAGIKAADLVENNMMIGIGTGSTVAFFIEELGRRTRKGLNIKAVTTSFQSKLLCIENGIPLLHSFNIDHLDLAVDGADELDRSLNLIKGGGAAQTIEKIIAEMAQEFVVIADETKLVDHLCQKFPLPVEIIPDAFGLANRRIRELGGVPTIRMGVKKDGPVITDNGNFILDITFESVPKDLYYLESKLKSIPGLLETGLFLGIAKRAIVAAKDKVVELYPDGNDKI